VTEPTLGALERLDARAVWQNEAHDFTPWLHEHIHVLGQALGLEIDIDVRREVPVGLFSADLLGTDLATQATILIENQLEQTDHSHLGQLLTYAGGLDAGVLVWVATHVREEHRQALTWLNERTREEILFFGVEIELLRIGDSLPAPHFKVVVAPNEWQKAGPLRRPASRSNGAAPSERKERYKEFWRGLLTEILSRDARATTAKPERVPAQSWYGISIGRSGFQDNFTFAWEGTDRYVRVELYIDVGDQLQNEAIFDALYAERSEIEAAFGEPLEWHRREDVRMCRIYCRTPGTIEESAERLAELQSWGADRMLRMRDVFGSRVRGLPASIPVE
jgi:Domain of unknown function (DUF4268)